MPITKINACSRHAVHSNMMVWQHKGAANLAWITISDPLRLYDGADIHGVLPKGISSTIPKLAMRFDDAQPHDVGWCVATQFDESHANDIIDFVKKVHMMDGNTLLVINCFAGRSRSVAVGKVIGSRLGAGVAFFSDGVLPNAWIMKVLNREWNKPTS